MNNQSYVHSPILITSTDADQVIACRYHSFILSKIGKLENPAKSFFINKKSQPSKPLQPVSNLVTDNSDLMMKIDAIINTCKAQSQSITQLAEVLGTLQQQSDNNKREIRKIQEAQQIQEQKMNEMRAEINSKLDVVIKYNKDKDRLTACIDNIAH